MILDWNRHERMRCLVDQFHQKMHEDGSVDLPMFDAFVTEARKDWEDGGYDLNSAEDLYKLWSALEITTTACNLIAADVAENPDDIRAVAETVGSYISMTGLMLRDLCRHHPDVPPVHTHD